MLVASELCSGYAGSEVLHHISLKVPDEKITLVTGPNGAGKSTLLETMLSLIRATSGHVSYNNEDITNRGTADIIKMGIGYSPQGARVFPTMSVRENLEMGGYVIKDKEEIQKRIKEIEGIFPLLRERMNQKAGFLSGGERQLLVIARSLISMPRLILLDEPSAGLDIGKQKLVFERLKEVNKAKIGVHLVEQNIREALPIADYVYFIASGQVKNEGEPKEFVRESGITDALFRKV